MNIISAITAFERAGIPVATHRRLNGPAFNLYLGDGRQVTVNVHNQKSIHGAIAFMKRLGRREAV